MKYYITNILLTLGILSLPNNTYSQRATRSVKSAQIKATSKKSVGLVTSGAKRTCSNPGDPNCIGPNQNTTLSAFSCPTGQIKGPNNYCICEDADYIVNPDDKTKCIQKTSPVGTALKKECGNVLIKAVQGQCKESYLHNGKGGENNDEYKCYDAAELYSLFDTSTLKVYTNGQSYNYDEVCYSYTEDLLKSIATDYDTTGPNSIACKRARAIANSSSECFALVLSTGKALGATKAIKSNLENTCGLKGINSQYQKLFGEIPAGINFPINIPNLYINAGKSSVANGVDLFGKFLDGKITDKTDTWEREITVINNSYLNQVSAMCGQEYAVSMHNEDIQIVDEKSSLQRMIDEKGAIAGASEWAGNQASVFVGESRVNQIRREGVIGGIKDEEVKTSNTKAISLENISSDRKFKDKVEEYLSSQDEPTSYILFTFTMNDGDKENNYFRIVKTTYNSIGDNKYEYETIDFNKELNLPANVLSETVGKQEKTDLTLNGKVKK